MQRKITLVSRLKRNLKSQLLWGAGIYCSSSKPLQSLGSDLNRNLWLYGCWEKGPPLVVCRSHTQVIWCRVPFFSVTTLYCFLYTGRALYRRAGLFHFRFPDLCHPASEILSRRTAKANGSWFGQTRYLEQDCPGLRSRLNSGDDFVFLETRDL